jgi:hypothetical protein
MGQSKELSLTAIAGMPAEQKSIMESLLYNISMLNGRIDQLEKEIGTKRRRIAETQLVRDLRKDEQALKAARIRLNEAVQQFNGIFNMATGYDQNRTIHSKYEQIFREMDEEEALIAAEEARKNGMPQLKTNKKVKR